ncbi:PAS fold family [Candidatus Vecturithrix granuli]|uniref:histidine kinase n=1 Tax=Vecturithrix granuli TaxID=1499967 RepID=A0A081BTS9_VECG1|nr:PAS fold family [Candidatus Vecturithrix granuli]
MINILIVEDMPETRELLCAQLSILGYEVMACADAEKALTIYQKTFYAILVVDLGLPGMDGLELCRRIRSLPQGALSMILVITGQDAPHVLHEALGAGADDYLVKPVDIETLKIRVTIIQQRYMHRLQRRQVQEELLRYREQLEDLVEKRTAELKQTNLALQREVHKHTQARQSLYDSEERYRILFESASDLIFTLDDQGNYCSANPKTAQNFGIPAEELVGKNLRDFFPEPVAESRIAILKKIFHTPEPHWLPDVQIDTPQGKKWFSTNLSPITNERGQVKYVLGIGRDVTARKQTEEELVTSRSLLEEVVDRRTVELKEMNLRLQQEIEHHTIVEMALKSSEANLRTILDSSRQSFMLLDRDGIIQALNQTARKDARNVYGQEIAEGSRIDPAMFYGDPESILRHFEQALRGEFVSVEHKVQGKDKLPYWFVFHYNPVMTADGQVIGVCLAVSDITERKQMEMNLQETKETADGANKAKSEFLTNISHELRTPLNIILGYTQLLKKSGLTEKQLYAIETIQQSGDHLLKLVDDILDFSRFDLQKIKLRLTNIHFPTFLDQIVHHIRRKAQQKQLTFHYEAMSPLPEGIYADEQRLRQLLQNLLDNAIKFTQQGSVIFRVGEILGNPEIPGGKIVQNDPSKLMPDDNVHLIRFQIEDTGVGIDKSQWNRVFLPFYQIPHRWVPKAGTGLGLAISRKLARMMNGDLYVESIAGQGSIFWCDLKLPVITGPFQPLTENNPRYLIGFRGEKKTLLVVDDDEYSRKKLKEMLIPLGFTIIEAMNGSEAIRQADHTIPDLIIMDLVMPEMDGFEVMRRIRQNPKLEKAKILAISASAFPKTCEESFLAGCDDFLTKPLHFDEVLDRLQVHLGLEWLYEPLALGNFEEESQDPDPMVLPSREDLQTLLRFADLGNITGIQEMLENLTQQNSEFRAFVVKIDRLARKFDFEKMIFLLRSFVE